MLNRLWMVIALTLPHAGANLLRSHPRGGAGGYAGVFYHHSVGVLFLLQWNLHHAQSKGAAQSSARYPGEVEPARGAYGVWLTLIYHSLGYAVFNQT